MTQLEPAIKKLRAQARNRIHQQTDSDSMWRTGPSTTGDIDILVLEAEMIDNGRELDNPHIPSTEDKLEATLKRLDEENLRPAWEVVRA